MMTLKVDRALRTRRWRARHSRGDRVHPQVHPGRSRCSEARVHDGIHGLAGNGESCRAAGSREKSIVIGLCVIDMGF